MSPLLRKRSAGKKQTIALLDIGSGSVGAALVEIGRGAGEAPAILAVKRLALRTAYGRNALQLQAHTLRAAREALAAMQAHTRHRNVQHLAIFLPAPWSTLNLHTVRFSQSSAFLADHKLLQRMITQHVQQEQRAELENQEHGQNRDPVFERTVTGIKLNGYLAPASPADTEVFTIELMLASARAPQEFLAAIQDVADEFFSEVTFHSSLLAAAHALSAVLAVSQTDAAEAPFLLCDGEGEIAELMVVKDGIPEAHAAIPVGYGTIVRTLASHAGLSHEEIPSALALAQDPRSLLAGYAKEAIALAQKECAEALGNAEPICASSTPRRGFIIGDGPEAQWFAAAVVESPRLRAALPKDFAAEVLTAKSIGSHVAYQTGRAKGDVMLGLEALFAADRFGNPDVQNFYVA